MLVGKLHRQQTQSMSEKLNIVQENYDGKCEEGPRVRKTGHRSRRALQIILRVCTLL